MFFSLSKRTSSGTYKYFHKQLILYAQTVHKNERLLTPSLYYSTNATGQNSTGSKSLPNRNQDGPGSNFTNGTEGNNNSIATITEKLGPFLQKYEDIVGLTEVKEAQNNVIQAEKKFGQMQERRRQIQEELSVVQARLKVISADLDKTNRGDDRYLELVKSEHMIIREEHETIEKMKSTEKIERDNFAALSAAVRESHEKERARAERTKYWSIIGSILGAIIGISGTFIANRMRMKELRNIVTSSADNAEEVKSMTIKLIEILGSQYQKTDDFFGDLKMALGSESKSLKLEKINIPESTKTLEELSKHTHTIVECVQKQESVLESEIKDIKRLLGLESVKNDDQNIVYVGPEIKSMLNMTEKNLEWKLKMNSLATVTLIYGGIAVIVPLIVSIFKGP